MFALTVAVVDDPHASFTVTSNVASLETSAVGDAIAGLEIVALPLNTLQE